MKIALALKAVVAGVSIDGTGLMAKGGLLQVFAEPVTFLTLFTKASMEMNNCF
jgi:hypothetical protein